MDTNLLKKLGNINQIAGIREAELVSGRGKGLHIAEFHNAAGLSFTVCPDRCMDIMDLSYKGINFSFQTKNGPCAPAFNSSRPRAFCDQWPGGMLVTCGLDNVGGGSDDVGGTIPTHGRISSIPAEHFGTYADWEGDNFILRARGDMNQTRLYGRNLKLTREIETDLYGKKLIIHDTVANMDAFDEPFMLLYHINFGYPLLNENCKVYTSETEVRPRGELSSDPVNMMLPIDGRDEEFFVHTPKTKQCWGAIVNPDLKLGGYISFATDNLDKMGEWKMMHSHDYVLALEPCNCAGNGRNKEIEDGTIKIIPAYSKLDFTIEIGVLEGDEILKPATGVLF